MREPKPHPEPEQPQQQEAEDDEGGDLPFGWVTRDDLEAWEAGEKKRSSRGQQGRLLPAQRQRLEVRFRECFDTLDMDKNEEIEIGTQTAHELKAALQVQGLSPSLQQVLVWWVKYQGTFSRKQFGKIDSAPPIDDINRAL
jgi:hypothetical protein